MKIGIPSTMPDLNGMVENKLGNAAHLLVIETDDMSFKVTDGPSDSAGPGSGVHAVSLIVDMGAKVILVGYIAPHIANTLRKQGIKIVTHISGPVSRAVTEYIGLQSTPGLGNKEPVSAQSGTQNLWINALGRGLRQFRSFLPLLVGVILLLGLLRGFVPEKALLSMFSGSVFYDSFWGACMGSILAGNPVNSYVIGKSLFSAGVNMAGITALMLAWVNVGLIQLPAESKSLGLSFALIRNFTAFVVIVIMCSVLFALAGGGI